MARRRRRQIGKAKARVWSHDPGEMLVLVGTGLDTGKVYITDDRNITDVECTPAAARELAAVLQRAETEAEKQKK